ncbi:MAG: DUF4157 domain-containing protein [Candidatus Cybelea sp.]
MSRSALAYENDAVTGCKTSLQRGSLRINRPHDSYEREADRVADSVNAGNFVPSFSLSQISVPRPLQRSCSCGGACDSCQTDQLLQRSSNGQPSLHTAPESVHNVLRSPGRRLDPGTRAFMESRFGHDFSRVRIHTDDAAAFSAQSVSANAYTVGENVVFGPGKFAPDSASGRRLIAHELTHVVQQSPGGTPVPTTQNSHLEQDAGGVSGQIEDSGATLNVHGRSGIGLARDAAPSSEALIEVKFPDGTKRLTPGEFAGYKNRTTAKLRSDLNLTAGLADNGRQSQESLLNEYHGGVESLSDIFHKPKALIGIAADMKAGVTPPYIGMWGHPKHAVELGLSALDRGDLVEAARNLQLADQQYRDAMHEWNAYREATIGGAEGVVSNLETVRDVSFAIALAAGAAVAAPAIAAVAGTSALGTAATAVGTATVTGAGGAVLRGGSTALASYAATGKVDKKAAWEEAGKGFKEGAVTGLTAGLGSAAAATGKLGAPIVQQMLKKCLTEASVNVAGEVTSELLDKAIPSTGANQERKALVPAPARSALVGCVSGALGVPVAKLGPIGSKVTEHAVGASLAYADARLAGQSDEEARFAAVQSTLTSVAVARGHAGTEHAKAQKAQKAQAESQNVARNEKPAEKSAVAAPAEKSAVAAPAETPPKSPTEKLLEQQKTVAKTSDAPVVLKEDAIAKAPTGEGHEVVVTEHGVAKCSPSPCPVIHVEYAKELEANPWAKKRYEELQQTRKTDPERAAQEAVRFIKALEILKAHAGRPKPAPYEEPAVKKGPEVLGEALAETGHVSSEGREFELDIGKKTQKKLRASEDFVGDRPLTFDIDEVLPVGEKGITKGEARARALDAYNRQLLDPATNRRSKHLGIDPREARNVRGELPPISVSSDPHALVKRRFSEVHELQKIFDKAVKSIKNKAQLSPAELKKAINAETRRIISEDKGPDAVAVRKALTDIGFEWQPGLGFVMMKGPPGK